MTKPPLNERIEWDGSETPPVPVGTEVTCWFSDTPPISGLSRPDHSEVDPEDSWHKVTAYLVHEYPPEDEVEEYMLEKMKGGRIIALGPNCAPHSQADWHGILRFTNGIAEIVSQEKA